MSSDQYKKLLLNPAWKFPEDFPPLAKNLFLKSTILNPQQRYSAYQILKHPFLTRNMADDIPFTI